MLYQIVCEHLGKKHQQPTRFKKKKVAKLISFSPFKALLEGSADIAYLDLCCWKSPSWCPVHKGAEVDYVIEEFYACITFLKDIFWCGPFLKFLLNVTILLLFYVLVFWPRGMWDLSSLTRDWTRSRCIGRRSLNHWTAREVPHWCMTYWITKTKRYWLMTVRL